VLELVYFSGLEAGAFFVNKMMASGAWNSTIWFANSFCTNLANIGEF
jgi:hypothetical protein